MDEVARVVSTAFTLSNSLRRDTELSILFVAEPPPRARRIRITGSRVRYLNPDERSTAALLKNALTRSATLDRDVEASPGLVVGPLESRGEIERFARTPGTFWLEQSGPPIETVDLPADGFGAILSDPEDASAEERALLETLAVPRLSLGPQPLRSSQCIDVVHHELDRRGRP